MTSHERDLVIAAKSGDTKAFGELYDAHIKKIYNFVYFKTRHKETAEDLTSETFFKALNKIKTVDPAQSFSSWLYRIAQNTVIDHFRAKRPTGNIDDVFDLDDETDIVGELDTKADVRELTKNLKNLSSIERDIIIMRVWQDMSYKEIAEIVGKSEGSCKMMYFRTLEKLRQSMPLALLLILISKM